MFAGGDGENAASLRASVCERLDFLGLRIDPDRNAAARPDSDIAAADSKASILVIRTREELVIAGEAGRLLAFSQEGVATD